MPVGALRTEKHMPVMLNMVVMVGNQEKLTKARMMNFEYQVLVQMRESRGTFTAHIIRF